MKLDKVLNDVHYVYSINGKILLQYIEKVQSITNLDFAPIRQYNGSFSNNYLYRIEGSRVDIFDLEPKFVKSIFIDHPSSIIILGVNNYVIGSIINDRKYNNFYLDDKLVLTAPRFFGEILNKSYRLNYSEGTFNTPRRFRCSDLLDFETYWEYDCGDDYVADRFFVWKDNLVLIKGGEKGSILLVIELRSGKLIWERNVSHGAFNIDEERGILVSVWGNEYLGNNFQIIDLSKQDVISEKLETKFNFENVNVHWQQQFFYKNKLYFTDNVHSYGDDLRPIKFGRFDIETKKVDFLQEVPEAAGGQFAQVIYSNNKLYLRTSGNELFIFENETV